MGPLGLDALVVHAEDLAGGLVGRGWGREGGRDGGERGGLRISPLGGRGVEEVVVVVGYG